MKITETSVARIGAIAALIVMMVGHLGSHPLIWTQDPISTFAARAPLDGFVTASMVLSAFALILVCSAAVTDCPRRSFLRLSIPVVSGMAGGGLLLLATFEETISVRLTVDPATPDQIRFQGFHDAGLLLFFLGSLAALCLLGILWMTSRAGRSRYLGLIPLFAAILAWGAPGWPIFPEGWAGLSQRVSLLFVWIGLTSVGFGYLRGSKA